jgi:hypothetical protein
MFELQAENQRESHGRNECRQVVTPLCRIRRRALASRFEEPAMAEHPEPADTPRRRCHRTPSIGGVLGGTAAAPPSSGRPTLRCDIAIHTTARTASPAAISHLNLQLAFWRPLRCVLREHWYADGGRSLVPRDSRRLTQQVPKARHERIRKRCLRVVELAHSNSLGRIMSPGQESTLRECQVREPTGLLPIAHSPQCRLKTAQVETCREVGAQVLASPRFLALRLLSTMAR